MKAYVTKGTTTTLMDLMTPSIAISITAVRRVSNRPDVKMRSEYETQRTSKWSLGRCIRRTVAIIASWSAQVATYDIRTDRGLKDDSHNWHRPNDLSANIFRLEGCVRGQMNPFRTVLRHRLLIVFRCWSDAIQAMVPWHLGVSFDT